MAMAVSLSAVVTMRRVRVTFHKAKTPLLISSNRQWRGRKLSYMWPKLPFSKKNKKLKSSDKKSNASRTHSRTEIARSMSYLRLKNSCKRRSS